MTEYPGFLSRQSLVDFCRERVSELESESDNLYKALEVRGVSDEDWSVMHDKLTMNIGNQIGYRRVCEWAATHTAPPVNGQEALKVQYDG